MPLVPPPRPATSAAAVPPPGEPAPSALLQANAPEWSVGDLAAALKRTLEDAFGHVRLRGEITGYRGPHGSGHAYFSLKDGSAKIDAVVWKGVLGRLRQKPKEGLEVVATGKITTFAGKSSYQIVIDSMEPAGIGAWMALLEERKRQLAAEGLFEADRKRPIPFLPRVIGVVTSPTGAVIRDILHRLEDRFPRPVLVWPVRVQGEGAAPEIAAAIRKRWPPIEIILTAAYFTRESVTLPERAEFYPKPVDHAEIVGAMRRLMKSNPSMPA